ncbi:endo alpha-1,4 polygalactosaminidase [Granulicoccus phenolivorans]|uniref:endo alpha-1,4 polygalactosaminidase n=1 Tax=Granulicoccus phenolivorans TaxID=266854 RepID=UPI00041EF76A|nr:endo alpha-1,4 polygalactosaminidase [Granulicoccus phenolivorans]
MIRVVLALLAGLALVGGLAVSPAHAAGPKWVPEQGSSFQIQYSGRLDLSLPVDVYLLDGEDTTAAQVAQLKARGVRTVCYINAGAYENWRSDKSKFPRSVIGKPLDGWDGENWLDVNRIDVLLPIMSARMDVCAQKGFDAVDPDNTDGWSQNTGFRISKQAQINYQIALAGAAHDRGLAIGLKNDVEQLPQLGSVVDFAVNEECGAYNECDAYNDFLASGKAVFNIEYEGDRASVCPGRPDGMSTVIKHWSLDAYRVAC